MEGTVTYRYCAFLGSKITIRGFQGKTFHIWRCTHPKSPWWVCPSSYSDAKKDIVCRLFRTRSVMNSFDTEKEGDDG